MALISQPKDRTELQLLRQQATGVLDDMNIDSSRLDVTMSREYFMRGLAVKLSTHMLADHLENQTVQYSEIDLPRWLRWLHPLVKRRTYEIKLDAYYAYPEARVAIPDLGDARKLVTFAKYEIPENLL